MPAAHTPLRTPFNKPRRPFGDPVSEPKQHPGFEPPPLTNLQNLVLGLDVVIPSDMDRITKAGQLVFHALGDSGGINGTSAEDSLAAAMEAQITAAAAPDRPAFLYHLGDVVYYNGQTNLYRQEFYEPFQYYAAPIFAIPGNHDGDTHVRTGDPPVHEPTLTGFMSNFCDSQPRHRFPYRATMTQPYAFWTLETPFATIIGLYSNIDGLLDGPGTNEQLRWLQGQLRDAPKDRCLILTVHHPPYSLDTTHGGYAEIGAALDKAIGVAGRWPNAVFTGHVHNMQRFTRTTPAGEIPYVIAGAGGYAHDVNAIHKMQQPPKGKLAVPFQTTRADVRLDFYNDASPGFLRITVDKQELVGEYFLVPFAGPPPAKPADTFRLDWKKQTVG